MKIMRFLFIILSFIFLPSMSYADSGIFQSLKVFNDTKNVLANTQNANKEDFLIYTLTVTNNTALPLSSYVLSMDVSQILPFADLVDNGGGVVSGEVINFPALTIPAGASVSKSFQVRVKYFLSENISYKISATFGNTVIVAINEPSVLGAFVAPTTGGVYNFLFWPLFLTLLFAVYRNWRLFNFKNIYKYFLGIALVFTSFVSGAKADVTKFGYLRNEIKQGKVAHIALPTLSNDWYVVNNYTNLVFTTFSENQLRVVSQNSGLATVYLCEKNTHDCLTATFAVLPENVLGATIGVNVNNFSHESGSWIENNEMVFYVSDEGLIPVAESSVFKKYIPDLKVEIANEYDMQLPLLPRMQINDPRLK